MVQALLALQPAVDLSTRDFDGQQAPHRHQDFSVGVGHTLHAANKAPSSSPALRHSGSPHSPPHWTNPSPARPSPTQRSTIIPKAPVAPKPDEPPCTTWFAGMEGGDGEQHEWGLGAEDDRQGQDQDGVRGQVRGGEDASEGGGGLQEQLGSPPNFGSSSTLAEVAQQVAHSSNHLHHPASPRHHPSTTQARLTALEHAAASRCAVDARTLQVLAEAGAAQLRGGQGWARGAGGHGVGGQGGVGGVAVALSDSMAAPPASMPMGVGSSRMAGGQMMGSSGMVAEPGDVAGGARLLCLAAQVRWAGHGVGFDCCTCRGGEPALPFSGH